MLNRVLLLIPQPFLALVLLASPVSGGEPGAPSNVSGSTPTPANPAKLDAQAALRRRESLQEQSAVRGGTGLLHLQDPLASAPGTFRVSLLFDTYKGSGFLCNASTPCPGVGEDVASHFGTTFNVSVAPLGFLEAYASLDSYANSNDARTPSLISAVGNSTFALKAFTPEPLGKVFRFGGAAELGLLGNSGVVGVAGGGTSVRFLGLALADFRGADGHGAPIRAHLNMGYFLDNSATLVKGVEAERGEPVTRIERFGLKINRVDQFQLGVGLDALLGVVRPFAEWNVGVPVNRQGYACFPTRSFSGDGCLATDARLSAFPSELTLGARLFPWLPGLSATAAVDVGTTGTSNFIEELSPTMPWTFWLGVGYGFDTTPPPPVVVSAPAIEKIVVAPTPPDLRLRGLVHEENKSEGIGKAQVTYDGRELTGMVTTGQGRFTSQPLEPGTYTLSVEAPEYEVGHFTVTIAAGSPASADVRGTARADAQEVPTAPGSSEGPNDAARYFDLDCALKPLPPFGTLVGTLRDGAAPIAGATASLRDPLGREIVVTTGPDGSFRFSQVPPGKVTLGVVAEGYLYHGERVEMAKRAQVERAVGLRRRPKIPHVKKTAKELVLSQAIRFDESTGQPMADSLGVLEEIADLMALSPELRRVEVQAHGDSGADPSRDDALTEQRASGIRDWLVSHGIDEARVSARGMGSSQPLSPNITPAGRARNRRVKLVVVE
jgi:outer membrane protein OmpA-like peptidoglycan-associated protein